MLQSAPDALEFLSNQRKPLLMFRSYAACSDLKTRAPMWSCFKNAEQQITRNGQIQVFDSVYIAACYRDRYSEKVKR